MSLARSVKKHPRGAFLHSESMLRRHVQMLISLRWALIALLLATGMLCQWLMPQAPSWSFSLLMAFGLLIAINLLSQLRLRAPQPVDHDEVFLQILFDLVVLTWLFRESGGSSNPFITYYLVPLAVAASTLAWRQTCGLAVLMLGAYGALFWWPSSGLSVAWPWHSYQGHLLGMWANFGISAGLLVFFLGRMHQRLRQQEQRAVVQQRQQLLRNQALALGSLAATAVHDLATPLATLTLLAEELDDAPMAVRRDMQAQLQRCRAILAELREQAQHPDVLPQQPLAQLIEHIVAPLRESAAEIVVRLGAPEALLALPWKAQQVITHLVKNALEAPATQIWLTAQLNAEGFICEIRDNGPGFSAAQLSAAQAQRLEPYVSAKPDGLGLGLCLAQITLDELGGELDLANDAGAVVSMRLPMAALSALNDTVTAGDCHAPTHY